MKFSIMHRTLYIRRTDFFRWKLYYSTSTTTVRELYDSKKLTDFPTTFKPKDVEQGWYDVWQRNNYFAASRTRINSDKQNEEDKEPFKMILPPPNVTGVLHLGHAFSTTIQDVLARWHRMKGYPVEWIPGLDHAGIATQVIVERTLLHTRNITRQEMGRAKFTQFVEQWKMEKAAVINQQLKTLGATLDWDKEYFTTDENHSTAVVEAFMQLYKENLLYRGTGLVNWLPTLRTTISDIEVEDFVVKGKTKLQLPDKTMITVGQVFKLVYPIKDSKKELIVATTRPETIFGDVAVAVYVSNKKYSEFIGQQVLHPITKTLIPIVANYGFDEFGTGAVNITPAHDRSDYIQDIVKKHGLPVIPVIDEDGNMTDVCQEFKGLPRFIAREKLMNKLWVLDIVKGVEDNHTIILPRCSRTYEIIEYLPKKQWFLRTAEIAKQVRKIMKNGKLKMDSSNDVTQEQVAQLDNWLENASERHRDWCISRQLWWGHRIPAYYVIHGDSNDYDDDDNISSTSNSNTIPWIIAQSEEEARLLARKKYGDAVNVCQDPDVLDTWFSSALVPLATFGWPKQTEDMKKYPRTLMVTGHDIYSLWIVKMIMLSKKLTKCMPFKEVLLHGVLGDANGKKMSKSAGNVISPENIINGCTLEELNTQARRRHETGILSADELQRTLRINAKSYPAGILDCGVDALRFSLCTRNIKSDTVCFDVDDCRTSKHFCNKIWQVSKYVLLMVKSNEENEGNGQQHKHKEKKNLSTLDRWILSRLSWMVKTVNDAFAERNFHQAVAAIRQFLHFEFCDLYVEGTKFGFRSGNPIVSAGHSDTLTKCLDTSLRVLSPIMPYLSDDLYTRLAKKGLPWFRQFTSLLEASYPMPDEFEHSRDVALEKRMRELVNVIDVIRICMANVSKKSNPEVNILVGNVHDCNFYEENINLIKGVSKIWNVSIHMKESMNDNFNETAIRDIDHNPDNNGVYITSYTHTDFSLLITTIDASVLEQVRKNIARKKRSE